MNDTEQNNNTSNKSQNTNIKRTSSRFFYIANIILSILIILFGIFLIGESFEEPRRYVFPLPTIMVEMRNAIIHSHVGQDCSLASVRTMIDKIYSYNRTTGVESKAGKIYFSYYGFDSNEDIFYDGIKDVDVSKIGNSNGKYLIEEVEFDNNYGAITRVRIIETSRDGVNTTRDLDELKRNDMANFYKIVSVNPKTISVKIYNGIEFFIGLFIFIGYLILFIHFVKLLIRKNKKHNPNSDVVWFIINIIVIVSIIAYFQGRKALEIAIDKPIIYLYPKETMNLQITLGNKDQITTSYPKYENNGWNVLAEPNGDLTDIKTNKRLYSLYWEGMSSHINDDLSEGFVVKGEDVAEFLDEKLEILGLNYKEREEFIVYWLPQMENNKYNFIRFALTDECNSYMPLMINKINDDGTIEKADVDTLIRVLMIFKPLNSDIKIKEQMLPRHERSGFTVIEWGGSKI